MFTPEQLAKAKTAKSAEELFAYAKEIGAPMNEDEAKVFFEQWSKEGELADEELENVSGGSFIDGCCTYSSDPSHYLIVTGGNSCPSYEEAYGDSIPNIVGAPGTCWRCVNGYYVCPTTYCTYRTYENDPYNQ